MWKLAVSIDLLQRYNMSELELAIEELKTLPNPEQEEAARFIHSLKEAARAKREAIIEKTFGCLSLEEAESWEKAINEQGPSENSTDVSW